MTDIYKIIQKYRGDEPWEPDSVKEDYDEFKDYPKDHVYYNRIEAYETLDKLGYDQVPTCSSWQKLNNTYQTVAYGKEKMNPEHLMGFMTVPWVRTTKERQYTIIDDAYRLYYSRGIFYPETLKK